MLAACNKNNDGDQEKRGGLVTWPHTMSLNQASLSLVVFPARRQLVPLIVRGLIPEFAIGKRVRELTEARHLSQEKLAELADLHRNYVGGVERGERNIALLNIVRLAQAVG